MRHVYLITLAAGLLAAVATPASAGTIKLTNAPDAGPVQVTFDEGSLTYGTAFDTINGATPSGLYADLDFSNPSAGIPYNGFANFFGGGTVAANFVIPFQTTGETSLLPAQIQARTITIQLAANAQQVGFDFIAQPNDAFTVELLSGGTAIGGSAFTFATQLDTTGAPLVGFAGLRNLGGFDGVKITLLQDQFFAMNDLRFGVAVVPLPPAAFTGLGLLAALGIAYRLRRRRQLI